MWQGDIYLVIPEGKFLESYTLEADPKLIAEDWAKVNPPPLPYPLFLGWAKVRSLVHCLCMSSF